LQGQLFLIPWVTSEIRSELASCNGYMIDIFSLSWPIGAGNWVMGSSYSVGKSHSISTITNYQDSYRRRSILRWTNDDGAAQPSSMTMPTSFWSAWSRVAARTPTCIYLGVANTAFRAANYPLH